MFYSFPAPLRSKIIITMLIGLGCLILGVAYFFMAHDTIFLCLSGIIFVVSIVKALGYFNIAKKKQYETVVGTCVFIAPVMLRKFMKIKIMDAEGVETTVNLRKGSKLKIGEKYCLYFKRNTTRIVESDFIETMLATDNFLGFEVFDDTTK